MKYVEVIYRDEIEAFIESVDLALKNDKSASTEFKTGVETFINEFSTYIAKDVNNLSIRDLRSMKPLKEFTQKLIRNYYLRD